VARSGRAGLASRAPQAHPAPVSDRRIWARCSLRVGSSPAKRRAPQAELVLTGRDVGLMRSSGRGRHDPDRSLERERLRVDQLPCLVDLGSF
jgi:hypothetical protein